MLTPRNPEFEAAVRTTFAGQAFMTLIGAEISHLAPGEVDIACARQAGLTQQHGFFHAGVTSAIADTSAGLAALSLFEPGNGVLTSEYKINLVAPGDGGALLARGRVIRSGRTLTVCKSDVFAKNEEGETLIATGLFTMIQ
ncbi:MAG: PaaI family thioesterase, partial [Aestuariivirgaceae bacterium]